MREERVDILDAQGNPFRTATRTEMRQNRLPHRCTYILVKNSLGEFFVHQRTFTKDVFPGYWDITLGGVVAAGESFDQGAVREVEEELGVAGALQSLFSFRYLDSFTDVWGQVYLLEHNGPFTLQVEEIQRGEFLSIAEFERRRAIHSFCPDGLEVWHRYLGHLSDAEHS